MKEIEDLGAYGGFILLKNKNFDDLKKDYQDLRNWEIFNYE